MPQKTGLQTSEHWNWQFCRKMTKTLPQHCCSLYLQCLPLSCNYSACYLSFRSNCSSSLSSLHLLCVCVCMCVYVCVYKYMCACVHVRASLTVSWTWAKPHNMTPPHLDFPWRRAVSISWLDPELQRDESAPPRPFGDIWSRQLQKKKKKKKVWDPAGCVSPAQGTKGGGEEKSRIKRALLRAAWRTTVRTEIGCSTWRSEPLSRSESVRCGDACSRGGCQSSPPLSLAAAGCSLSLLFPWSSNATGADGGSPWSERGSLHL